MHIPGNMFLHVVILFMYRVHSLYLLESMNSHNVQICFICANEKYSYNLFSRLYT